MPRRSYLEVVREDDGFDLPPLGKEDGSAFGFYDRMALGTDPTGKYVTDMADWEARDLHKMIEKDYKAKQIENVLSLPISSAEWNIEAIKGGDEEAEWLKRYWDADCLSGGCRTSLDEIINLMTTAFYYKRAYFEKVFVKGEGDFEGKTVYADICWRPQTTCRLMRDPKNGRFKGFEQEPYYLGPEIRHAAKWPIQIPPARAFVYTHGIRHDPLNGSSDMEVAFWAWKTKQKVLMLWFQFLQGVSLPKVVVKSQDTQTAVDIAREIARMKSSGVLPVGTPGGPDSVGIDTLDLSGKGAEQFLEAIRWLDRAATQSILAGFLDLSDNAAQGAGSYALSQDLSSFFLQALEAKAREMEDAIRKQLFAPLIYHNFGPKAKVPRLSFEPLNDIDKTAAMDLLKAAMMQPPGSPIPTAYISGLAEQVASYLGLDGEAVREDFKKSFDAAAEQAKAEAMAEPGGNTPAGQQVAGVAGATKAAADAVKAGLDPKRAFKDSVRESETARRTTDKREAAKDSLRTRTARAALEAKTGEKPKVI